MFTVSKSDIMDVRKLQLVGRASFSVTLPPGWIKENNLKPGDQITLTQEEDGSLKLISGLVPEPKKFITKIDADRCKQPGLLQRLIVGGYVRGAELIEVVSKNRISREQKDEIQETVNGLLGLGVMEVTSDHVMIQSMIDHSKFPIVPLLKRLCWLASSMQKDAIQALRDKDMSLAADVTHRENEVNKIYWLAVRQLVAATHDKSLLQKLGLNVSEDLTSYRTMATRNESRADFAEDIAKNVLALGKRETSDKRLLQKVIQLGEQAHEAGQGACEAFFKGHMLSANSVVDDVDHFEERAEELIKEVRTKVGDTHVGTCLIVIIRDLCSISECAKRIAEITINNSIVDKGELP